MPVTMKDLMPFIGKEIEFLPAIVDYEGYLEVGMRATVVNISGYDESDPEDPVFKMDLSLEGHDDRNLAFELCREFYDRNGTPCLSAREAGMYGLSDFLYLGNNWATIFKLVDPGDANLVAQYNSSKHMVPNMSYVQWLEDFVKIAKGL